MELDQLDKKHRDAAKEAREKIALAIMTCGGKLVEGTVSVMAPSANETPLSATTNSYETIPQAS